MRDNEDIHERRLRLDNENDDFWRRLETMERHGPKADFAERRKAREEAYAVWKSIIRTTTAELVHPGVRLDTPHEYWIMIRPAELRRLMQRSDDDVRTEGQCEDKASKRDDGKTETTRPETKAPSFHENDTYT